MPQNPIYTNSTIKIYAKIKDDIVYSRQMAKAHYPSDIKFGEKLAKSLFDYLKTNDLIN